MDETILLIINGIHMMYLLFVVLTPFTDNLFLLILHSVILPFMMGHWYLNNNTCAITICEKLIRYKLYGEIPDDNECFMGNLINPVFDLCLNNSDLEYYLYIGSTLLWSMSVYKLYNRQDELVLIYNKIKN